MFKGERWLVTSLALLVVSSATKSATTRAFPNYDYGGKTHSEFLQEAIERSSPENARLLAELFGGLELGLELSKGAKAVISVGGAATRCQHQSPCFDSHCNFCYDPLLRIHGKCGGASYFTCRGTLPDVCLPYTCTALGSRESGEEAVFVKKFPRFEDTFCLGIDEKARSLETLTNSTNDETREFGRSARRESGDPEWVLTVPDAVTACQGYDICLDLKCGSCYDPYLGAHTSCGKLTYYDCADTLPPECQPMRCTETNVNEIFPFGVQNTKPGRVTRESAAATGTPLMVRNFPPLRKEKQNCM